jgi:DNA-binding beta-propeller fold protein YncE
VVDIYKAGGMRRTILQLAIALIAASALWVLFPIPDRPNTPENREVLRIVADVPLPGPAARFDYQSLDVSDGRLYIAHMNADQLVVFDTRKREVVANLDGFHRVHGVLAVPELDRIFASVTGDHQVAVVDRASLKTLAQVGEIKYPDGLAYASSVQRLFVSDEHGDADAVIDATNNTLVSTVALGGGAGNTVYDRGSDRIYVAVHGKNELVTIDPLRTRITARTPLTWLEDPHGIVLDVENQVAFVAGAGNNKLVVVDLNNMQEGPPFSVGRDPDVLAFDNGTKRLYVAAESGHIKVFHEANRTLEPEGDLHLPHGHTVAVDPKTHLVYFPLEDLNGKPVLRIMEWVGGSKARN